VSEVFKDTKLVVLVEDGSSVDIFASDSQGDRSSSGVLVASPVSPVDLAEGVITTFGLVAHGAVLVETWELVEEVTGVVVILSDVPIDMGTLLVIEEPQDFADSLSGVDWELSDIVLPFTDEGTLGFITINNDLVVFLTVGAWIIAVNEGFVVWCAVFLNRWDIFVNDQLVVLFAVVIWVDESFVVDDAFWFIIVAINVHLEVFFTVLTIIGIDEGFIVNLALFMINEGLVLDFAFWEVIITVYVHFVVFFTVMAIVTIDEHFIVGIVAFSLLGAVGVVSGVLVMGGVLSQQSTMDWSFLEEFGEETSVGDDWGGVGGGVDESVFSTDVLSNNLKELSVESTNIFSD
jgi:hypothetical protein